MCAASQKQGLACLDSTQTVGVNAIASLEKITGVLNKNGKGINQMQHGGGINAIMRREGISDVRVEIG